MTETPMTFVYCLPAKRNIISSVKLEGPPLK